MKTFFAILLICAVSFQTLGQKNTDKILAFYTGINDQAHVSFVKEANQWFAKFARDNDLLYESTNDWSKLNETYIKDYQLLIFLDTRPEVPEQRLAFQKYMDNGGAWLGFHFSAFVLEGSAFTTNWNWYHDDFLGCGQYKGNTWRPTSANLKIENPNHPVNQQLPAVIKSAPNEWYSWQKDLRQNQDIEILASIDSTSFPLGTGPKPHEIWHKGYYPVGWTNKKYKMVYFNMGHNDMDYKKDEALSHTFSSENQNKMISNSIFWLLKRSK